LRTIARAATSFNGRRQLCAALTPHPIHAALA
jgi:hypothetical protein